MLAEGDTSRKPWVLVSKRTIYPQEVRESAQGTFPTELPDLGRVSTFTSGVPLSVLLRPESPPLLGRPIRLCASTDVPTEGSLEERMVIFE